MRRSSSVRPLLLANGGELTVGRRTSSYVYGAVDATNVDGSKYEPGHGLGVGYVYRPPNRRELGRFDVSFVRADVVVNVARKQSNFEEMLDQAADSTEGRLIFEKDISGHGLAGTVPGKDYDLGEIVDVQLWGQRIPAPVTEISMVEGDSSTGGWRVHVGGQLISDWQALKKRNQDAITQLEDERISIAGKQAEMKRTVAAAARDAEHARGVVDSATSEFNQNIAGARQAVVDARAAATAAQGASSEAARHSRESLRNSEQAANASRLAQGYSSTASSASEQAVSAGNASLTHSQDADAASRAANTAKAEAEKFRRQAEEARRRAENDRAAAELARTEAEQFRRQAEEQRSAAESARNEAEKKRAAAERARTAAEAARQIAQDKLAEATATAVDTANWAAGLAYMMRVRMPVHVGFTEENAKQIANSRGEFAHIVRSHTGMPLAKISGNLTDYLTLKFEWVGGWKGSATMSEKWKIPWSTNPNWHLIPGDFVQGTRQKDYADTGWALSWNEKGKVQSAMGRSWTWGWKDVAMTIFVEFENPAQEAAFNSGNYAKILETR